MCLYGKFQQILKAVRKDEVNPLRDFVYHIHDDGTDPVSNWE